MEQTVSERARGIVEVVLGVELVEAPPAKLILALLTLHVLAAARVHNYDLALGTGFPARQLVQADETVHLVEVG